MSAYLVRADRAAPRHSAQASSVAALARADPQRPHGVPGRGHRRSRIAASVSILPQGYFPWVPDPDGTHSDVTLVRNQVKAHRGGARPAGRAARRRPFSGSRWSATTTARCTAACWRTATTASRRWCWRRRTRPGATGSRRSGSASRARRAPTTWRMFAGLDPVEHTVATGRPRALPVGRARLFITRRGAGRLRGLEPGRPGAALPDGRSPADRSCCARPRRVPRAGAGPAGVLSRSGRKRSAWRLGCPSRRC